MNNQQPKFDKEKFRETVAKALKGPGRIKLKDIKKRGSGKKKKG